MTPRLQSCKRYSVEWCAPFSKRFRSGLMELDRSVDVECEVLRRNKHSIRPGPTAILLCRAGNGLTHAPGSGPLSLGSMPTKRGYRRTGQVWRGQNFRCLAGSSERHGIWRRRRGRPRFVLVGRAVSWRGQLCDREPRVRPHPRWPRFGWLRLLKPTKAHFCPARPLCRRTTIFPWMQLPF